MNYMNYIKPANFYAGAKVQAVYQPTGVPDYDGNPLIEALLPIMTSAQAAHRLSYFPKYDDKMRQNDDSIRYHLIRTSSRFFSPMGIHIDLERKIACALRMGLIQRNPVDRNYSTKIEQNVDNFIRGWADPYNLQNDYISTYAPGFNFVGISGQGKSQTLIRILRTLPQVIFHNNYKGRELIETQLVWLKLDCPFDGSIKGLCLNFFQAVDTILGTNYLKTYAGGDGRQSATAMIPSIASVAANHHLGIFVIDEIQRLDQAASGGKDKMLNFFVQLVNNIGVAIVSVGTFKALEILNGTFSQMRRGTGQGDIVWDRMSFNKNWDRFIKSIWKYQFTLQNSYLENPPELSKVLYDECQGIIDLAIKAYMFAQERAIETKIETITPSIIRSAARDKFQIIRPALEAFRNKKKEAIKEFEDAYPEFLEKYIDNYSNWSNSSSSENNYLQPITVYGEITKEPEIINLVEATQNEFKDNRSNENVETKSKSPKKSRKKKSETKGLLLSLANESSQNENNNIYNSLVNSGFTSFTDEFGFNSSQSSGGGI